MEEPINREAQILYNSVETFRTQLVKQINLLIESSTNNEIDLKGQEIPILYRKYGNDGTFIRVGGICLYSIKGKPHLCADTLSYGSKTQDDFYLESLSLDELSNVLKALKQVKIVD